MGAEPMPLGVTTGCCGIACAETGALRQTPAPKAPKAAKLISVRKSIVSFPFWRLKIMTTPAVERQWSSGDFDIGNVRQTRTPGACALMADVANVIYLI
jgi:hypothetical protein